MMRPSIKPGLPLWATREFRWLVIAAVMGLTTVAVLVFEIAPRFNAPVVAPPSPEVLVPAEWRDDTAVRFDGLLANVKDRSPLPEDGRDPAYAMLLRNAAKADPPAAKKVDYRLFDVAPDKARGRSVKVAALFLGTKAFRVNPEGAEVEFVHRTFLSDLSGREGYVVDLLQAPPSLEKRSPVSIDAVFLRLATYEAQRGPVAVPLLVARSLRPETDPTVAGAAAPSMGVWVAGVSIAATALVGYFSVRVWARWRAGSRGISPFVSPRV